VNVRVTVKDSAAVVVGGASAIVDNQMLNGWAIRLDAGRWFGPK
jgi:hypothetical protein